ncbi:hypothetical protein LARI1_G004030 [Lachnellula arida]|uniref:Rhomboid family membrane protein n=1 Tax=Lachnellula arida TaxID=1316785 RepID=A0A8T9BEU2_9HELO|nr:hypothetical protein LARI1_G004030 [Lachnellula arida]
MSTTTPQPPSSIDYAKLNHNLAIATVIVCPALILLPPRKLDFYTFALLSTTFLGGNQLAQDYTGRSFVVQINGAVEQLREESLRKREERQKFRQQVVDWDREALVGKMNANVEGGKSGVLEEVKRKQDEVRKGQWKEERDKREKEAAEEGRGYGDLIMDQVWEVWSGGKKKSDTDEDEKVDENSNDGKR